MIAKFVNALFWHIALRAILILSKVITKITNKKKPIDKLFQYALSKDMDTFAAMPHSAKMFFIRNISERKYYKKIRPKGKILL